MANNLNISSIISPDILKTISASTAIKTLGNQLVDQNKEKIISTSLGKVQQLSKQIAEIIILEQKIEFNHGLELKRLDKLLKEKQITQDQYKEAVKVEDAAYDEKRKDLEALRIKLEEDKKIIVNDPFSKIKDKAKARKLRRAKRKSLTKAEKAKAKRDLAKKVISNAAKTLAPIIALQLANQFASIISQRSKLETLVDQVNAYIDQANTPDIVAIASNLRSNTITLINNTISKLTSLQKTLDLISVSLTTFNILIPLLNRTAPLTVIGVPPGVPIVTMVAHDEIRNKKQINYRVYFKRKISLSEWLSYKNLCEQTTVFYSFKWNSENNSNVLNKQSGTGSMGKIIFIIFILLIVIIVIALISYMVSASNKESAANPVIINDVIVPA